MEETISGHVESLIFKNEQSGFGIYRIVLFNSNQKPLTIKGNLATLELEGSYEFHGYYHEDSRFGMQFQVTSFQKMLPQDKEFIVRYLSGPSFPGIGPKTAEAIVQKYGETVLEEVKVNKDFKLSIKGVSKAKADLIIDTIRHHDPLEDTISFLMAAGLGHKQIIKITQEYGEDSINIIQENPYRLVFEIDGIGFKTADKVAQNLDFDENHPYRIEAYVLDKYENKVYGQGDSYCDYDLFLKEMGADHDERITEAVESLIDRHELVLDENRLYHVTQYESEVYIADTLSDFQYHGYDFDVDDFNEKLSQVESSLYISFDEIQRDAIESFLREDITILTGGPGTGKSTLLSGIVTFLQMNMPWLKIVLCAPTGRAAKRLEDLTNVQASTIHSILRWDLDSNKFGVNEENPLEADVVIIDEFSMVDTWLFANLLRASEKVKKFMFVGDRDQLPSVGSGFVLGDLIQSEVFKVIALQHNYRQEAGSEVIDLAVNMNQGVFDISSYHRDVKFFDSRYGSVKDIVLRVVDEALAKGYTLNDIQVLAPMYDGPAGIDNLNHFLQKMCNPEDPYKSELRVGTRIFREGDKILQLKNQPDDFVFNGDIGHLVEVSSKELLVDFDGNFVSYSRADFINITHAYAMSVHKAQGSEYPIVILIAMRDFYRMLSRRLYYTGATRSSKSLILVGQEEAFRRAVENHSESRRLTYLHKRLIEKNKH